MSVNWEEMTDDDREFLRSAKIAEQVPSIRGPIEAVRDDAVAAWAAAGAAAWAAAVVAARDAAPDAAWERRKHEVESGEVRKSEYGAPIAAVCLAVLALAGLVCAVNLLWPVCR